MRCHTKPAGVYSSTSPCNLRKATYTSSDVYCSGCARQYQGRRSVGGDVGHCGNVTVGGRGWVGVASCVVDLSEVRGRSRGGLRGLLGTSPLLLFLFILAGPHLLSLCELLAHAHLICWPSFAPILAHLHQPLFMLAWPVLAHVVLLVVMCRAQLWAMGWAELSTFEPG